MLRDIVNSSSHMIAKLKRSGEASSRNDNFLIHQYFQRALANEKLNKIDRAITDYSTCISIDRFATYSYLIASSPFHTPKTVAAPPRTSIERIYTSFDMILPMRWMTWIKVPALFMLVSINGLNTSIPWINCIE